MTDLIDEALPAESWEPCSPGCPGYGVFHTDRMPSLELQACQDCRRFPCGPHGVDDDAAAVAFVRDLENFLPHAARMARALLDRTEA